MTEFKILPEFPNYEIWNNGDIYNKNTNFILHGTNDNGYRRFNLYHINGKQKLILHHQLIAKCFIPNPNNLTEIDHINGNKLDNRISNLRWVTRAQNMRNRNTFQINENTPQSGFKFVTWDGNKWFGGIKINKKTIYIGTDENAENLYKKCLQKLNDISTTEELFYYNKEVIDDMIKYEIIWILTPDDLVDD